MASFTDQIQQFNPYLSRSPLIQAMVAVGTQKQQQYDQGVQKIQGYIDNIAGMDVASDADKKYLQSTLNQLGSKLKTVAAGDFSNQQLVNSVGGMATQIIKDPVVQNAVYSTANYRKELARMQKDIDDGKSDPANVDAFNKRANAWLSSDKPGQRFSGSYIPYFDIMKYAKETFDAIKPDGLTTNQIYLTDENGNIRVDKSGRPIYSPLMKRLETEGRTPEKVKQTIDQIFSDGRVSQQLEISGQYAYRGHSPNDLTEKINRQKEDIMASYDNKINELALKKGTGKDVQDQIDKVQLEKNNLSNQYDELSRAAQSNPEAIRGLLYKNDVRNRFTTMFGESKTKETISDNPGWNANFKLQQEANAQSRWYQDHQFQIKKLGIELAEKEKDRQLRRDIAMMKLKGKGTDADLDEYEKADMPGQRDLVANFESDLTKAADNYTNSSDNLIWQAALSKAPGYTAKLNAMLNQGIGKDQAIKTLIDQAAVNSKMTPTDFRAKMSGDATVSYNNMTPQQRRNNPDLDDAYALYHSSKRNFDMMNSIKAKVDEVSKNVLGKDVSKATVLGDIKPVTAVVGGKQITLTPEDFYDMAIYLKGNESSLGFLNDKVARDEARKAETRLAQRGKDDLLSTVLQQQGVTTGGAITGAVRAGKAILKSIPAAFTGGLVGAAPAIDLSQVNKIYDRLGNEYAGAMSKKADILRNYYVEQPNLKAGLMTGDPKVDKVTVNDLKRFAGAYAAAGKNVSPDFKSFASNVDEKGVTFEAQAISGPSSKPMVEVVAYGADSQRLGGMVISNDEAKRLGVNVDVLHEPKEITNLRIYMNSNGDQTSKGDPKSTSTYIQGDSYLSKNDFINIKGTPYDVQANITYSNGLYYANIYGSNGIKQKVMTMPGSTNLQKVVNSLVTSVTPQWIEALLTEQ